MIAAPDDAVLSAARKFLRSFKVPGHLLAAVSGGSDSTGLLLCLHAVIGEFPGFSLSAATVDHGLRAESGEEAEAVARLCVSLGVAHQIRRWDGDKPKSGIQAAARMARYRLLADAAQKAGAVAIVTGHTRDDQLETISMRAGRTTDPAATGLSGMADAVLFDRSVWILRPFLNLDRTVIRAFVQAQGVEFVEDPSNLNPVFERARLRQKSLSRDTGVITAASEERFRSSARCAAFLERSVRLYEGLAAHIGNGGLEKAEDRDSFRALLTLAAVLGGREHLAGKETAARIRSFLGGGGQRMTAGRVVFDRRRDGLYLYREARGLSVMQIASDKTCDWDGRFRVSNGGSGVLTLSVPGDARPVAASLAAAGLSEAIAKRAAHASLSVSRDDVVLEPLPENVSVERLLAPFDAFLPRFDLAMADALAHLAGRAPYVSCPVHIV